MSGIRATGYENKIKNRAMVSDRDFLPQTFTRPPPPKKKTASFLVYNNAGQVYCHNKHMYNNDVYLHIHIYLERPIYGIAYIADTVCNNLCNKVCNTLCLQNAIQNSVHLKKKKNHLTSMYVARVWINRVRLPILLVVS